MNDIILNFLNTKNQYSIKNGRVSFNYQQNILEPSFHKNQNTKRNNLLIKIHSYLFETKSTDDKDYKSIKTLENNIIETFTFLKNNNLIPRLSPLKINFRFLRDSFTEQNTNNKEQFANPKLNAQNQINFNIQQIRNNSLNNN